METLPGISIHAPVPPPFAEILSPDAQSFLAELSRRFESRRQELLQRRQSRQKEIDQGRFPDFLPETEWVRKSEWQVRQPIPGDLLDRRVEITGPVDRKMVINALNSGAKVFMADFEDSNCPTWTNNIQGQINLRDAIRGTILHEEGGKSYKLNPTTAVLFCRTRGWHLDEAHFRVDGVAMSGSLFDFGLYVFHNGQELARQGKTVAFYCPKIESHLEARLWNDAFSFAESTLNLPTGTIRATFLIETIMAAFEMDEILWEVRDHSAGLNCGRWDYIFSYIKKFRNHRSFVVPDRSQVTMEQPFLKAYVDLLIKTCHRRGIHAMGGMAAQIPIRNNPAANDAAFAKVRNDKLREVKAGHDGTWVAHPALVSVALQVFNENMPSANQIHVARDDVSVTRDDLLRLPTGQITMGGLEHNVHAGLLYLEAWLQGQGAVAIDNLMEDAATAEIALAQLWQWIKHEAVTSDGRKVTPELVKAALDAEVNRIVQEKGKAPPRLALAARIFEQRVTDLSRFADFVTLAAYPLVLDSSLRSKL